MRQARQRFERAQLPALPARPAWRRTKHQRDLPRLAVTPYVEVNRSTRCHRGNDLREITRTHQWRTVDRCERVALFDVGGGRRAARFRLIEDSAVRFRHAEALGKCSGHRTDSNADPTTKDIFVLLLLLLLLCHCRIRYVDLRGVSGCAAPEADAKRQQCL